MTFSTRCPGSLSRVYGSLKRFAKPGDTLRAGAAGKTLLDAASGFVDKQGYAETHL
ncbi:hypothetical protein [Paracoccus sp. MKU1]|uniref:hypothetical protein n=1 Tax=Paracoccus sp. MKU1 TaxID=1745182 RepID=UPI00137B81BD|nr:hypothetical protein [Paracoccus sp. MKU1]